MRIALLSDLHANGIALRAVLGDLRRRAPDRVVCLGDVATLGPEPAETIAALRELGCDCIEGNHDTFLLEPERVRAYDSTPLVVEAVDWCRAQLSPDDLEFVRGFAPQLDVPLNGAGSLRVVHGTPRSNMEDLLPTTPPDELDAMLDGHAPTALACGHTHLQMLRQHRGMWIVNPGSVGAPFRELPVGGRPVVLPHAEYATLQVGPGGLDVTLHRVELDRAALRAAAERCGDPIRAMLRPHY